MRQYTFEEQQPRAISTCVSCGEPVTYEDAVETLGTVYQGCCGHCHDVGARLDWK